MTTDYKVTDTELTSVADAIRAKGGTALPLEWPTGYVNAINALPGGGVDIVPWSTGTDEQIAAMLDAAQAGDIDLQQDGEWAVGDVRTINVSAFTGSVAHVQQDIDIVIASFDDYNSCGCLLQFDFKDQLAEGVAYSFPAYGDSNMYSTELPALVNALPTWLKDRLVTFDCYYANNSGTLLTASNNKLALRSLSEVTNGYYISSGEGKQLTYYQQLENRIKKRGHSGSDSQWWTRTRGATEQVAFIDPYGNQSRENYSSKTYGIAPFGCIGGLTE